MRNSCIQTERHPFRPSNHMSYHHNYYTHTMYMYVHVVYTMYFHSICTCTYYMYMYIWMDVRSMYISSFHSDRETRPFRTRPADISVPNMESRERCCTTMTWPLFSFILRRRPSNNCFIRTVREGGGVGGEG